MKKEKNRNETINEDSQNNNNISTENIKIEEEPITNLGTENENLEETINKLQIEISSLKDMYLRKQADFENFRKRSLREKEDIALYTKKEVIEDFIELIDNFERALKAGDSNKDFDQFYQGISMIYQSFASGIQKKHQLESFAEEGDTFDPEKHEAISVETDENVKIPLVKEVFQKGYSLKGKTIRTAKVKVIQS